MRNAALVLGIVAGLIGMVVGFFSYGYTVFIDWFGEVPDLAHQVDNVALIRATALVAPILALAGGAMARSQAQLGGALMILSAAGMYYSFHFNVFTMFPIAMAGLAGVLALAATRPDSA